MTIFCAVLLALTSLNVVAPPPGPATTENAVGQLRDAIAHGLEAEEVA